MTRKRVKLAFISNDSSRKTTFKKRKKGLLKKVNELSTLCGINACTIIYSPYDTNPEVWPSVPDVQRIVSEFKALPEMDQQKKMMNQETFLRERLTKASDHLKRQRKENREIEMTEVMFQSLVGNMGMFQMNIMDLNDLCYMIEQYLKDIHRQIEISKNSGIEIGESSNTHEAMESSQGIGSMAFVASTTNPITTISDMSSSSSFTGFFNPIQQQQQHPPPQFRHSSSSHVGLYEQPMNMNMNLNHNHNHNQNQHQWMELMNHSEQLSYVAEQMTISSMDNSHHNNNHHHYQPQHQHQQIIGESSTDPTTVTSSTIIPVTDLNLTNNIWFH